MPATHEERRVITFYAFKGGVGRTMALANVAYRLAERHGLDVVAVDWDLEAPGLHTFFEVPQAKLEQAKGLLDYCEDWEEAYRTKAPEPPRPLSYLIPIEEGPGKPNHGSLRLLIAGKQDRQYDARLGRFDWRRFYAESAGAGAVEHLRSELVANADVILVDSRTGLTDPGGICTIQLPDGVVLMTAPNKQSIEGIERVARSIATAEPAQRAGRRKARTFLCMSRVPFVEETERTRRWFKEHEAWFDAGAAEELWRKEEHPQKAETHVIPQRAYYGFDESLVGPAKGELAREPLAQAYDVLTENLLFWLLQPLLRHDADSLGVDATFDVDSDGAQDSDTSTAFAVILEWRLDRYHVLPASRTSEFFRAQLHDTLRNRTTTLPTSSPALASKPPAAELAPKRTRRKKA